MIQASAVIVLRRYQNIAIACPTHFKLKGAFHAPFNLNIQNVELSSLGLTLRLELEERINDIAANVDHHL
jgi:hypothetical protein